jgi:excisionase family DNA binding protein
MGIPQEQRRMTEPNAAYSLYATPSEFARFVVALLMSQPDPGTLGQSQIAPMLTSQVAVNDAGFDAKRPTVEVTRSADGSWGLGWGLQHMPGREAFWHWGDNGSFQAFVMGFPRLKAGMVCMANGANGRALWADLFGAVFGPIQPAIAWLTELYDGSKTTPMMTIEEAASYLRLHPLTIRRLAGQGTIPAFLIGRQWRIKRTLLDTWLADRSLRNLA